MAKTVPVLGIDGSEPAYLFAVKLSIMKTNGQENRRTDMNISDAANDGCRWNQSYILYISDHLFSVHSLS